MPSIPDEAAPRPRRMYVPNERPFLWETHLSQGHWTNLPAELALWYRYNYEHESRTARRDVVSQIIPIIGRIVAERLTRRQQQVVAMYFGRQCTQVQIAAELGITQPTVSQHLSGKMRHGKKIGGALKRIRKAIRKLAAEDAQRSPGTQGGSQADVYRRTQK